MRRTLLWLLTLPFAAASILAGHAAAYALTGAPADAVHSYLEHAPQVVAILVLLGLLGLAHEGRTRTPSLAPVAVLAATGFACQEHLEQLAHTGDVPFLLTSATFWLGVALQLPFAAAVWYLARRLARPLGPGGRSGPPRLAILPLLLPAMPRFPVAAVTGGPVRGRGPPASS
jgi:hypothetical protein